METTIHPSQKSATPVSKHVDPARGYLESQRNRLERVAQRGRKEKAEKRATVRDIPHDVRARSHEALLLEAALARPPASVAWVAGDVAAVDEDALRRHRGSLCRHGGVSQQAVGLLPQKRRLGAQVVYCCNTAPRVSV